MRYFGLTGATWGEDRLGHRLGVGIEDASVLRLPREAKHVDCRGGHGIHPVRNAVILCENCLVIGTTSAVDCRFRPAQEPSGGRQMIPFADTVAMAAIAARCATHSYKNHQW